VSLASLMSRNAIIIRRNLSGSTDIYGDDAKTESVISTTCELQQEERTEEGGGAISETRWVGFFPVSLDLQSEDAVEVDGYEYELVGDPWVADTGNVAVHHLEATLRRVRGTEDIS
jgi:hypothetical protein